MYTLRRTPTVINESRIHNSKFFVLNFVEKDRLIARVAGQKVSTSDERRSEAAASWQHLLGRCHFWRETDDGDADERTDA